MRTEVFLHLLLLCVLTSTVNLEHFEVFMNKKYKFSVNSVAGLCFMLVSGGIWTGIQQIPATMQDVEYGPAFWPTILCVGILLTGIGLIVFDFLGMEEKVNFVAEKKSMLRVLGMALTMILYVVLLSTVGYLPATIVAMILMLLLFRFRHKILLPVIGVGFPVFVYLFFTFILKVKLP